MYNIHFRKFNYQIDSKSVFESWSDPQNQSLISHQICLHTLEMFEQWITEKFRSGCYHDFYMIDTEKGETLGFIFSYDFHLNDGHCKYTLCLYEKYQNKGYGAAAAILFLNYLFSSYPLRQVFVSVFDYNTHSLQCNQKSGFREVGCLPDYRFLNGHYYDLHYLHMTREDFYSRYDRTLQLLLGKSKV